MKTSLLTLSTLLAASLFVGCGSNSATSTAKVGQPHDTSKLGRVVNIQEDWSWFVDSTIKKDFDGFAVRVDFWQGLPSSVKHYQYFMDTDNDKATGYNGEDGWEITGADYLIEDGMIFQYKKDANKAWNWEAVREFPDELLTHKGAYASLTLSGLMQMQEDILGNATQINTMMEVYDKDWAGDYPTVTDVLTTINNGDVAPEPVQSFDYKRILDPRGNVIALQKLTPQGTWHDTNTYTYNAQGQKISSYSISSRVKKSYTYNDKGDLASRTFTHSYIKGVETFTYVYDAQGRKTTMTKNYKEYRKDVLKKEKTEVYEHTYLQDSDLIDTITLDGAFYQSFTYNADDTIKTKTTRQEFAGAMHDETETFTYDAQGRVIKIVSESDDGGPVKTESNYTYQEAVAR